MTWQHGFPHCPSSCQWRIPGALCSQLLTDSVPASLEETEVINNKDNCRKVRGIKRVSGASLCQRANGSLNIMSQQTLLFTHWKKSFSNPAETERQTKHGRSQGWGPCDGSAGKDTCCQARGPSLIPETHMMERENILLQVVL